MPKVKPSLIEVKETEKSLVTLSQEAKHILSLIIEAEGELSPEVDALFKANGAALTQKIDAYVHIEDEMEATMALIDRRIRGWKAVKDRIANAQDRLRERVKFVMQEMGAKELNGKLYRYKLSAGGEKLVIDDESKIPQALTQLVQHTEIDKDRVKAALKDGLDVPGARLEAVTRLLTQERTDADQTS